MGWAALADRLAYMTHRAGGVWHRANDPWRVARIDQPRGTLFESLQHLLRLAEACPSGPSGDEIRRTACELIEADSSQQRSACRTRMLNVVDRLEWRRSRGRHRGDDPAPLLLKQLTDALGPERRAGQV